MAKARRRSRLVVTVLLLGVVAAALAAAFWPRAALVDLGVVTRGPMMLTIDEEGRTRVHDAYVVSTPVAGRLQRVQVHPGDPVVRGETIVAHMQPSNPSMLDIRTREQALAVVQAAEAALRVAQADLNAAQATLEFTEKELSRSERLAERGGLSGTALDRARQEARVARAAAQSAEAAISMREADLANARTQLIGFDDRLGVGMANGVPRDDHIPLYAPADGRILRVMQQSETTLPAGTPVMEIGDVDGELEVVVELISSDAVQVSLGDRVIIEEWGGPVALGGEVIRIDPFGITRFSALGVEEQRVPITVGLAGPVEDRRALGHGYRVEVRIVIWQSQEALKVPASALFRRDGAWSVYVAADGAARLTPVEIGRNNGFEAEVIEGLSEGDRVVLYPSAAIGNGSKIAERSID